MGLDRTPQEIFDSSTYFFSDEVTRSTQRQKESEAND